VRSLCLAVAAMCGPLWGGTADWALLMQEAEDHGRKQRLVEAEKAYRAADKAAVEAGDVEKQAVARDGLGYILSRQMRLEEAEALYQESTRRLSEINENHPRLGRVLNHLGELRWRQGRLAEALRHCERALRIQEKTIGPVAAETMQTLSNLGGIHLARGQYKAAEHYLEAALAQPAVTDPQFKLGVLANLGSLHQARGRLREAESVLERVRQMAEQQGQGEADVLLPVLNNLASVQAKLGQHDRAELSLARAVERAQASLGPAHPVLAILLFNRAVEQESLGRVEEAETWLRQAEEIQRKTLGTGSPNLARTMDYHARVLDKLGRKSEAKEMRSSARAIAQVHAAEELVVSVQELRLGGQIQ